MRLWMVEGHCSLGISEGVRRLVGGGAMLPQGGAHPHQGLLVPSRKLDWLDVW